MEEDELFQVQGKPEGSHWSLSLTLAEVQMHATVNNVPETACLQNRKKFKKFHIVIHEQSVLCLFPLKNGDYQSNILQLKFLVWFNKSHI